MWLSTKFRASHNCSMRFTGSFVEIKATSRVVQGDFKGLKALAEEGVFRDFFLVSQDVVATRHEDTHPLGGVSETPVGGEIIANG